jgi:hypothetical protein
LVVKSNLSKFIKIFSHHNICLKKTISILLIFGLTFNLFGALIIYELVEMKIHEDAEELSEKNISDSSVILLSFNINSLKNNKQFEWTRKDKEFRFRGKLYDIAKIVKEKGTVKYFCVNDKDEESLQKDYGDFDKQTGNKNNFVKEIFDKQNNTNYFFEEYTIKYPGLIRNFYFANAIFKYQDIIQNIHTPPPKV